MPYMDEPDEILDLVDENDHKIATIVREDIMKLIAGAPGFVRAANVFVVNTAGRLWIPRRQHYKKLAPGGLDFSAGEHVQAGENYEQAALRGLQEELRLEVAPAELVHIGTLGPSRPAVPYFEALFVVKREAVPHYNTEDFTSGEWIDPDALRDRLLAGEIAKSSLLQSVEALLAYNMKVKE